MAELWQHVVVIGAAAVCAGWLVVDRLRKRRKGKCAGCAIAEAVAREARPERGSGSVRR